MKKKILVFFKPKGKKRKIKVFGFWFGFFFARQVFPSSHSFTLCDSVSGAGSKQPGKDPKPMWLQASGELSLLVKSCRAGGDRQESQTVKSILLRKSRKKQNLTRL